MRSLGGSLEEIFLDLTRAEKNVSESAAVAPGKEEGKA